MYLFSLFGIFYSVFSFLAKCNIPELVELAKSHLLKTLHKYWNNNPIMGSWSWNLLQPTTFFGSGGQFELVVELWNMHNPQS
jgi:hypothetical protein